MNDLELKRKNGWLTGKADKSAVYSFCEGYKSFLNTARTEREFCDEAEKLAKAFGFKPLDSYSCLKSGDKVYRVNRNKTIMLMVIGSQDIESGVNIVGAHMDAPRLDLKQNPLYEECELALLKTHYYGGIKKYQWPSIPLAIHGIVILENGDKVNISIGDEGDDITFTITDLLPHLSKEQAEKKLKDAIEGESLNVLIGSIPVEEENKASVKLAVLQILNEKYNIREEDFTSAEIEIIPAFNAKDSGFDRSMVAAYGQDDRVCSYVALEAILKINEPVRTSVCLLVDKEEIGSMGNTGMQSRFFENTMAEALLLSGKTNTDISLRRCLSASKCLSGDVNAAIDPNYQSVSEKNNAAMLGHGVTICKYTGSGGKSGSSDASAEFVGEIRKVFNENNVLWQTAELGKIGAGGGGTIAQYVANLNIDTLDCGTSLLSMHSPLEVSSKLDVYMTFKAYLSFYESDLM